MKSKLPGLLLVLALFSAMPTIANGELLEPPGQPEGMLKAVSLSGDWMDSVGGSMTSHIHAVTNANEECLFSGSFRGRGMTAYNNFALFSDAYGEGFWPIARRGTEEKSPNFWWISHPLLADSGHSAFRALMRGPGVRPTNDTAVFIDNGKEVRYVGAEGMPAPGAGEGTFRLFYHHALGNGGHIAFPALLNISTLTGVSYKSDSGVWGDFGFGPIAIAREGDPAPGSKKILSREQNEREYPVEPVAMLGQVFPSVSVSGNGEVAFPALLTGVPATKAAALFAGVPAGAQLQGMPLRPISTRGDIAPVVNGTGLEQFFFYYAAATSRYGDTAFRALLRPGKGGVTGKNMFGLWIHRGHYDEIEPVVRQGDPSHERDGALFRLFTDMHLTEAGLFFKSALSGQGVNYRNDMGLWKYTPAGKEEKEGSLRKIVREGDLDPNTGAAIDYVMNWAANDDGTVVYLARLRSGDAKVTAIDNIALYADAGEGPILLLRKGQYFDLGATRNEGQEEQNEDQFFQEKDMRILRAIALEKTTNPIGGSGGHGTTLTNDNKVMVRLTYAFGNGAFFIDLKTITEPGSVKVSIPSGGNICCWQTMYKYFNDPIPADAIVTGVDVNFTARDQGWGGTGAHATVKVDGTRVGSRPIYHHSTNGTVSYRGPVPAYNYGGRITMTITHVGYPGWQLFWQGGSATIHYEVPLFGHRR